MAVLYNSVSNTAERTGRGFKSQDARSIMVAYDIRGASSLSIYLNSLITFSLLITKISVDLLTRQFREYT